MAEFGNSKLSKHLLILVMLLFLLVSAIVIGLLTGSANISLSQLLQIISGGNPDATLRQIIYDIRMPRVLLAVAIGGGLSVAGGVFQAILMNPLAEPYILGISSGGAFGAVFAILIGLSFIGVQFFSFGGALLVTFLVFILGRRFGELEPNVLLLSGVMVGAFFGAAILLVITLMNESLRTAVYWLIGDLSLAKSGDVYIILPITILVSLIISLNANKFNILALGDQNAKHLGINTEFTKNFIYIISSIMIGSVVSVSGIIGFVGLLVPHVCRLLFGLDNRIVIPAAFFVGGAYLVLADSLARTIISPSELPVGAVTAIIGAPIFIYLLRTRFNTIN